MKYDSARIEWKEYSDTSRIIWGDRESLEKSRPKQNWHAIDSISDRKMNWISKEEDKTDY